jgi:hypothetical protein
MRHTPSVLENHCTGQPKAGIRTRGLAIPTGRLIAVGRGSLARGFEGQLELKTLSTLKVTDHFEQIARR